MAGLYLRSYHRTVLRVLLSYLLITLFALGIGSLLSVRLSERVKRELLGYEPDEMCIRDRDRPLFRCVYIALFVDRLTEHVEHASKGRFTDRCFNRVTVGQHLVAAADALTWGEMCIRDSRPSGQVRPLPADLWHPAHAWPGAADHAGDHRSGSGAGHHGRLFPGCGGGGHHACSSCLLYTSRCV